MAIRKIKKLWALLNSAILHAIIVSVIVHFSAVFLIPSVQILPHDSGYIEVDTVWMEIEEEEAEQEVGVEEQKGEDEIQEQPQLNDIPTHLDAVEPDMLESGPDAADWDRAFIGIAPRLPENLQTLTQLNQFKSPANQPVLTVREKLASVENIPKQIPESEILQSERDTQPHDDVSLTAEQRYEDVIRSQTVQIPDEEISPGFTELQTPEVIDSKSKEVVPFRKIERTSPDTVPPVISRGEIRLDKWDKIDTPSVLLPDTQEISERAEDDIVVKVDNTIYAASQNRSRNEARDETEELPRATVPEVSPVSLRPRNVEQKELSAASHARTLPAPQEFPSSPILFPRTVEIKASSVKNAYALEKETIESEEVLVKAVEPPLSQKRLNQEIPTPPLVDEPEELPRTTVPEVSPVSLRSRNVEQKELSAASHARTLPAPQEFPSSPILFPRTVEIKAVSVKNAYALEKETIESEEVLVKAVEPPISQKRLDQEVSTPPLEDEPRSIDIRRDVQDGRHLKGGARLIPQPQRVGSKQSFVIGGKIKDDIVVSTRSHIGIFVQKEETLSQVQEPDVTLQEDDALKRIATDEDKLDSSSFAIEGPASERKVIYKPTHLPEVQIDVEVDIRLKFWVLPDGSVSEVIPLQRGDVRLERAAIEYLKNWRFTPVAPNNPKVWGIVPIKYKLQ